MFFFNFQILFEKWNQSQECFFQTFYKNNMWKPAVLYIMWLVMFAKTSEVWWKRENRLFLVIFNPPMSDFKSA